MTDQERYYDSAAETTRAHRLDEAATDVVYRTGGVWPTELDDGYVDARQPITTIRDLEQAGYVVSITKEGANDHAIQTR